MLYLYAIADAPLDLDGLDGLIGSPRVLAVQDFTIAAAAIARPPEPTSDALRQQDEVVRALHARVPALLPMRFGSLAPDEAAVRRSLEVRAEALRAHLDLVRGREQMTVRVFGVAEAAAGDPVPRAADLSGTAYLQARRAPALPAPLAPLAAALEPFERARRFEAGGQPGVVGTLYQLIDRGASEAYLRAVESAAAHLVGLHLRVSGPAPAYAFT